MERQLFNIFLHNEDKFILYQEVKELIKTLIIEAKAEENVKSYDVLRILLSSINNAGWQDRHSDQISYINSEMDKISSKYEEFLT